MTDLVVAGGGGEVQLGRARLAGQAVGRRLLDRLHLVGVWSRSLPPRAASLGLHTERVTCRGLLHFLSDQTSTSLDRRRNRKVN